MGMPAPCGAVLVARSLRVAELGSLVERLSAAFAIGAAMFGPASSPVQATQHVATSVQAANDRQLRCNVPGDDIVGGILRALCADMANEGHGFFTSIWDLFTIWRMSARL
jgi:hypothetical protein